MNGKIELMKSKEKFVYVIMNLCERIFSLQCNSSRYMFRFLEKKKKKKKREKKGNWGREIQ